MMVIKENRFLKDKTTGEHTKKTMACFKCGTDHIFFDMSPTMCWKCNQVFPSAKLLFNSPACRVAYHKVIEGN